jgi:hypothetical protein
MRTNYVAEGKTKWGVHVWRVRAAPGAGRVMVLAHMPCKNDLAASSEVVRASHVHFKIF